MRLSGEAVDPRVQSIIDAWTKGDKLAFALWAEFEYGDPDDTGRPLPLAPDHPYWIAAAGRLRERFPALIEPQPDPEPHP